MNMKRNWLKIGAISGTLAAAFTLGNVLYNKASAYVKEYSAALSRYMAAKVMPYDVPGDSKATIDDFARFEGIVEGAPLNAFRAASKERMFGEYAHMLGPDSQGNVTVLIPRYRTDPSGGSFPVEISSEDWVKGRLPRDITVWMPDADGNGEVKPISDYRSRRKSSIMADSNSTMKAIRDRGIIR
jgi:hypothetical protein